MKRFGKLAVCLAGGLALNAALLAADTGSPDNPYVPIVTRNVFALNPPTPVDITQPEPPAKITPNGIMSIFGRVQVLFKVTGAPKPGKPAGDTSYILSEGQRQDDIEVTHIDEKSGIVTFNNHGMVQELPLTKTPALTSPMPVSASTDVNPTPDVAGMAPGGNNANPFGNRLGRGGRNGAPNNGAGSRIYQPDQSQMTPEESAIMIAAQTERYRAQGNPLFRAMPPVRGLTPQPGAQPPDQ
jgi:hypothetical protein